MNAGFPSCTLGYATAVRPLPRRLQRTCEFCRWSALDAGLLQQESCELDRKPNASGGCDGWEPRYRVDGDE